METRAYDQFRLLDAIGFAARAHFGQERKHPENQPYISHPYFVATILMRYGYPEDVVIAGLLHDVVEDTSHTPADIERMFGARVAGLVADVTEEAGLDKEERMRRYIEHLKAAGPEAKAISAADFLANRYDLLMHLRQGHVSILDKFRLTPERNLEIDAERIAAFGELAPGFNGEVLAVWGELRELILKP